MAIFKRRFSSLLQAYVQKCGFRSPDSDDEEEEAESESESVASSDRRREKKQREKMVKMASRSTE